MDYARNPSPIRSAIPSRLAPSSRPPKPYNRSHMQPALRSPIPDASLAVFPVNGENSHQGFAGRNPAPHPVREACKFAVLLGLRGQAELNRIRSRYTGKERDAESGNDYFGARYYASNMGRFLSPDWSPQAEPVPYAKFADPQSLNLYAYVTNNPLVRVDPSGHCDMGFESSHCGSGSLMDAWKSDMATWNAGQQPADQGSWLDSDSFDRSDGMDKYHADNAASYAAEQAKGAERQKVALAKELAREAAAKGSAKNFLDIYQGLTLQKITGGNSDFSVDPSLMPFLSGLGLTANGHSPTGCELLCRSGGLINSPHFDGNLLHMDMGNFKNFPIGTIVHSLGDYVVGQVFMGDMPF